MSKTLIDISKNPAKRIAEWLLAQLSCEIVSWTLDSVDTEPLGLHTGPPPSTALLPSLQPLFSSPGVPHSKTPFPWEYDSPLRYWSESTPELREALT